MTDPRITHLASDDEHHVEVEETGDADSLTFTYRIWNYRGQDEDEPTDGD